ncbi:hypothetical protein RRF57_006572 [Xylaria bambusicola]|uniref:Protein YOP1 n=1 Tax=Xylaria bambusicola TaxID=326684 RepID=A0AAN7Z5N9_9PEZI
MSAQDRAQQYISQLDRELSKYPVLNNLEKQTAVPKVYAVIGVATLYLFFIIFNLGGQLLTNLAGFLIPGYYSLAALFSASKTDDTQWLTYWVVFSFFTLCSCFGCPFPPSGKTSGVTVGFCKLTQAFSGAQLIFRSFMQPMLSRYFSESGSTAANLRAKADSLGKDQ